MTRTLTQIAETLRDTDKKVQLIYAFNGTGKTRLSRELKNLIAPKSESEDVDQDECKKYYSALEEKQND